MGIVTTESDYVIRVTKMNSLSWTNYHNLSTQMSRTYWSINNDQQLKNKVINIRIVNEISLDDLDWSSVHRMGEWQLWIRRKFIFDIFDWCGVTARWNGSGGNPDSPDTILEQKTPLCIPYLDCAPFPISQNVCHVFAANTFHWGVHYESYDTIYMMNGKVNRYSWNNNRYSSNIALIQWQDEWS